jgi:class 3 adenylate cyclase/tetratricopeptide (TPR) repeat protein
MQNSVADSRRGVDDKRVTDGRDELARGADPTALTAWLDELLDRAVTAINRGDRATAATLAGQVLTLDRDNTDAADLLEAPSAGGEIRRLSILFADLMDSTLLSTRVEPETYRVIVGRYREQVLKIIDRFEGHIGSTKGDGLLAVFGHPRAHENDARRAVAAALEITHAVAALSEQTRRAFGVDIAVRVGVHRGLVYLDTTQDDVYGLAANLAARVSGLAPPNSVVVSDSIARLVHDAFELTERPPAPVKGVNRPIEHCLATGERAEPTKTFLGPLVGREREMARLRDAWQGALAGTLSRPGRVLRGEPGIGKSRLATEAGAMIDGTRAVELTGSPFHTGAGLHPVRMLLQRQSGINRETESTERIRRLEDHIDDLGLEPASFVPLLAPVVGADADAGYDPVEAEGRKLYELIAEAVRDYVLACIGDGPGLIVAEDVHWFDPSTLEILGSLLEGADGRLLVVLTGRPGDWLPDDWPVDVLELAPLDDAQADALIAAMNPALSIEAREAVVTRCDGVPFYIEQVVEGLSESGVPEALYEPLFARLRADANVVPVIEAAAVIGRYVDRSLLFSVLDLDETRIDQVIGQLEDALVLEPWGPDVWRFRHELLREVAAELAPPSVRRALDAKVGEALAHGTQPDWCLIAGHYESAERFDEAADAYERASVDALRRGALAEARTCLTRAINQLERAAPSPNRDRLEIRLRLQRGCMPTTPEVYQSGSQEGDFERCLSLGGGSLTDDELRATLTALVLFFAIRGHLDRALYVFDALGADLTHGSDSFRLVVVGTYGTVAWLRGEFASAQAQLELASADLATVDERGLEAVWYLPNEPRALALHHLALARLMLGDVARAEKEVGRAKGWIGQLAFPQGPFSQGYADFIESWICVESGRLDRAAVLTANLVELAERHGFDAWLVIGATQQTAVAGLAALAAGDMDVLSSHIETMTALVNTWRAIRLKIYLPMFDAVLGRLLLGAGDTEQARIRFDAGLQLAVETGLRFYDAELLRLRARTQSSADRQADVSAALSLAAQQGATLFQLRAALDDFDLRGEQARAGLVDVLGRVPPGSVLPEVVRARQLLLG